MSYNDLPVEVQRDILKYLDRQSRGRMSQVNRDSRDIIEDQRTRQVALNLMSIPKMESFIRANGTQQDRMEIPKLRGSYSFSLIQNPQNEAQFKQTHIQRLRQVVDRIFQANPQLNINKEFSGEGKQKKKNPWLAHVEKVRAKNPSLSYKECLVKAKQSYKK